VGSTLALAQPHYYDRLVQLASTIKFVHQVGGVGEIERERERGEIWNFRGKTENKTLNYCVCVSWVNIYIL
jgi:hypothetical protein